MRIKTNNTSIKITNLRANKQEVNGVDVNAYVPTADGVIITNDKNLAGKVR